MNKNIVDDEGVIGAELHAAAWQGRTDDALRILKAQPDLIRIRDPAGNTIFHGAAAAGHADTVRELLQLVDYKSKVVIARNGDGDTALHLALKNRHEQVAHLLVEKNPSAKGVRNNDNVLPWDLCKEAAYTPFLVHQEFACVVDAEMAILLRTLLDEVDRDSEVYRTGTELFTAVREGREDHVEQILSANPTLLQCRNEVGDTAVHVAASMGHVSVLRQLVHVMMTSDNPAARLTHEIDTNGNTALHRALLKNHKRAAQYLIEVAPEAAYQDKYKQVSPLSMAVDDGHDDLVRLIFQLMPVSAVSPSIRETLLSTAKKSLALAAVKARHLATLQVVMENLPSLLYLPDEKGWKLLSYTASKGYLDEVRYFLITFPESVEMYDVDGSLPIHKAVAAGGVDIVKEFIKRCPQTLNQVDRKGRTILHIAVRYARVDVLSYLMKEIPLETILNVRDQHGYTALELAKQEGLTYGRDNGSNSDPIIK